MSNEITIPRVLRLCLQCSHSFVGDGLACPTCGVTLVPYTPAREVDAATLTWAELLAEVNERCESFVLAARLLADQEDDTKTTRTSYAPNLAEAARRCEELCEALENEAKEL